MSPFVNINGRMLAAEEAGVSIDARAFRYGYGVFETLLVQNGMIRLESYHWERLLEGLHTLRIEASPYFIQEVKEEVLKTARRNGHDRLGRLRLQVWPSGGGLFDEGYRAEYCIESFALDENILELNTNGLVIGIAPGIVKPADSYSHVKSCSALPYAMAAREAKARQWNDALLLNQYGRVAESSIANIFWIEGEDIFTPPTTEGCVAGIMRRQVIAVLQRLGYRVMEEVMDPQVIMKADSIFLTNAIRGIRWVKECNEHMLDRGITPTLFAKVLSSSESLR